MIFLQGRNSKTERVHLPWYYSFLRACQSLDLLNQRNSFISLVGILAQELTVTLFNLHGASCAWGEPLVRKKGTSGCYSDSEIGSLEVEARHQLIFMESSLENMTNNVFEFLSAVDESLNCPILIHLVRSLLALPLGNAEVECGF